MPASYFNSDDSPRHALLFGCVYNATQAGPGASRASEEIDFNTLRQYIRYYE